MNFFILIYIDKYNYTINMDNSRKNKIEKIRNWFEINEGYLGRGTPGNSGLFSFNGALTLCSLWPSGVNIDDIRDEALDYVYNHPAIREYNSYEEWKTKTGQNA